MRNRGLLALIFLFVITGTAFADRHTPPRPNGDVDIGNHARLFLRNRQWNHMLSLDWRFESELEGFGRRSATLGSYYRAHRNLKIGGFYTLQSAVRHDDDWIARDDGFVWQDTDDRYESVFSLDATPRWLLPGVPRENFVLSWKNRLIWNTFNNHLTLRTRPMLTWFLLSERQPLLNIAVAYDLYAPLNFGDSLLYRHYPYLHAVYHLTPEVKLDLSYGFETTTWSTSEDVRTDPAHGTYRADYQVHVFSLGVIVYLDM